MTNVTNLHTTFEDQVRAMRGVSLTGYRVEIEGRQIPCLTMSERFEGKVSLCLDDRFEIDIPYEYAVRVAWMIANAHAIGSGYSHLGALNKDRPYAPEVVSIGGRNHGE